jgi:hypothetical protein
MQQRLHKEQEKAESHSLNTSLEMRDQRMRQLQVDQAQLKRQYGEEAKFIISQKQ